VDDDDDIPAWQMLRVQVRRVVDRRKVNQKKRFRREAKHKTFLVGGHSAYAAATKIPVERLKNLEEYKAREDRILAHQRRIAQELRSDAWKRHGLRPSGTRSEDPCPHGSG